MGGLGLEWKMGPLDEEQVRDLDLLHGTDSPELRVQVNEHGTI